MVAKIAGQYRFAFSYLTIFTTHLIFSFNPSYNYA